MRLRSVEIHGDLWRSVEIRGGPWRSVEIACKVGRGQASRVRGIRPSEAFVDGRVALRARRVDLGGISA